ncbi:MAG: DUF5011 domain-containing protein [Opitutae bacterium]|nr:DUF5011 domain-containing protein [Opitutae bacterium]
MIDNPPIPEITLLPGEDDKTDIILEAGTSFTDPGFTLANRYGKEIDAAGVQVESTIDPSRLGTYLVTYNYTDEKNNPATQRKRIVNVVDTTPPAITLVGDNPLQILVDAVYTDPGATAVDNLDGNVTVTSALKNEVAGLIANWTFNDGTGDKLKDSTGIIDGTLQNFTNPDTAWVDGKFGKALQFDGIDDYVLLPAASKLDLQKMTMSLWVNATNYAQQGFLFEKTANGLLNSQYNLFLDSTDELNFRLVQGGNLNDTSVSANVNLEADTWNHVAVTYDGFLKSIYINGELITAMPAVIPINMGPNGVSTIGAIGSGNDYFFNGLIDDIQIYNRAVPEGEIPFLMTPAGIDTSAKSVQPYVVVYSAVDSSGNAATVERTVVVSNDNTPPVITLVGEAEVVVNSGAFYEDEGATALDEADGNLTPFIDDAGTVDAIDTSKPGEYIITYDVEDFSGNKAVQVTRKVIVANSDPFANWALNNGLAALPFADRAAEADPDKDGIQNLLEYSLGGDPVKADRMSVLPIFDASGDNLTITYFRIKATVDSSLTYTPQMTGNLGDPSAWDATAVTLRGALQGVSQANLPDQKAFASSAYERVEARAKIAIDAAASGKQFLRLVVEKQ